MQWRLRGLLRGTSGRMILLSRRLDFMTNELSGSLATTTTTPRLPLRINSAPFYRENYHLAENTGPQRVQSTRQMRAATTRTLAKRGHARRMLHLERLWCCILMLGSACAVKQWTARWIQWGYTRVSCACVCLQLDVCVCRARGDGRTIHMSMSGARPSTNRVVPRIAARNCAQLLPSPSLRSFWRYARVRVVGA